MSRHKRMLNGIPLIILMVVLFILIAGCTTDKTIETTVDVKITPTGNISSYSLTTTMSEAQYQNIKKIAESKGYTAVRDYFLRDFNGASDYFEYNEPEMNSGKKIELYYVQPIDPSHTLKSISVKIENNQLYFNDSTFSSDYLFPRSYIKTLKYTLKSSVKGQKYNANSHSSDEYSFTWTYKDDQNIPTLYMISEPIGENTIKSPGFEIFFSIISLCVIGYLFRKNRV